MTKFYSSAVQYGNRILAREIQNGKRRLTKVEFSPTLFVKTPEDSKYKSLFGDNLGEVKFQDINDAKQYIEQYKGIPNYPIFGNTSYAYQYITENYPGEIDYDLSELVILTLDIETASEEGFPDVRNANEEVLLITVQDKHTKKITTFGSRNFDVANIKNITHTSGYEYIKCKNEEDLLRTFLIYWTTTQPDIITGWNTSLFDIPYLVNRIGNVMGGDAVKSLSPWNLVNSREITMNGRQYQTYDIIGVNSLDYLDLYKKFTYNQQSSYKLNHIAMVELGKSKLASEHETFKDFYTKDWQLFVEYNITDVELVDELEDKMRLIELITTMAYDAKCNYSDVYSATRLWDCIIYNHLWDKNVIVHQREGRPGRTIEGAFVKEPRPGKYDWVVSVDATSLYPSLMLQYNMSPETFIEERQHELTVDEQLEGAELDDDRGLAIAANGYGYTRDRQGYFPEIIEKIFSERIFYKKKMVAAQQEFERTSDKSLKKDISKFNNIQMARKIQLNSLYGAFANEWFRFYDDRIAEGITLSGQLAIRTVGNAINEYLQSIMGTQEEFAFYGDTDSFYISFGSIVDKFFAGKPHAEIIDLIDKICEEKLLPHINKSCDKMAEYTNAFASRITFKREAIADKGIWVAKKRYLMNVYDSEGVRYATPKLKVMGLETVRSTTPAAVRDSLKAAMKIMLTSTEDELQRFIKDTEAEFMKLSIEDIALSTGVNGIEKYSNRDSIYSKGAPMHVRASLLFNYHVKQKKLTRKYELIGEGSKVKVVYLTMPNPIHENCVAFGSVLPKELDLHHYVDYISMFNRTFLDPLMRIMDCLKWHPVPVATLDDLF